MNAAAVCQNKQIKSATQQRDKVLLIVRLCPKTVTNEYQGGFRKVSNYAYWYENVRLATCLEMTS
jgi:hypothetical protein